MDYQHTLITEFCNQLASNQKGLRHMKNYYLFEDRRPGTIRERFEFDAKSYFDYERMSKV